jgi:branched-chain amino acid transport system permease protein
VIAAHQINTWSHRQASFDASIAYLAFVLIGGSRTFLGPVAGGLFLTYLPEWLREQAKHEFLPTWAAEFLRTGRFIIYGVLLAASCVFFPRGLITPELLGRLKRIRRGGGRPRGQPLQPEPEAAA